MEETAAGSSHVVVLVVWAEVDPQEAICSRELGTGSVLTRMYYFIVQCLFLYQRLVYNLLNVSTGVAATRTLPGGWSVTSAKPPNQKGWAVALLSPPAVTEAEVEWGCVEAEGWTVVGRQEPEAQVVLEVSVEVGEATAVDSEDGGEWIGEVSVEPGVEDHPWTEWVAEGEEEWAHQVERWI